MNYTPIFGRSLFDLDKNYDIIVWLHSIEDSLIPIATFGEVFLETLAIACVFLGIGMTARMAFRLLRHRKKAAFPFMQIRLQFAIWLVLALEFQLGADILNTAIASNWQALGQLGAIAVIRTLLNYFLNKELEAQLELRQKAVGHGYSRILDSPGPEEGSED